MTRALLALAGLASAVAAITLATHPPPRPPRPAAASRPSPTGTPVPAPPRRSARVLNRQDRVSAAHRRRESRAFEERPLLGRLPLRLAGVRIDVAGLAAEGRRSVLLVDRGSRSHAFARAVYRRALAAAHDSGRSYQLRWAP